MRRIFFISIIIFLLSAIFISPAFSATKTIVSVIKGEVFCFDYTGTGEYKVCRFLVDYNKDTGWLEVDREVKLGYKTQQIRSELKPGIYVLAYKKWRSKYNSEYDICSTGKKVPARYEYINGEITVMSPAKLSEFIPEMVVMPVPDSSVSDVVADINNNEEIKGKGAGPIIDEETAEEEEITAPSENPPSEPTLPEEEETTPVAASQYYWVNPSGNEYTIGGYTISTNGEDSASRDGSNSQPWKTITYALTRVTGSTIYLVSTTYSTTTGETFPLNMKTNVDISGNGATIQGDGIKTVILADSVTGVDIDNVIARGGVGNLGGGGIAIVDSSVTVTNCTVTNNATPDNGGGIFVASSAGSTILTINNSTISSNTASGHGGGICTNIMGGSITLTVNNSTILSNTSGKHGGGIFLAGVTSGIFTGTTISSNQGGGATQNGGGLYADSVGSLTLTDCTISSNSNVGAGGGIEITHVTNNVSMSRCKVLGNTVVAGGVTAGAGMHMWNLTTGTFTNCLIAANGSASIWIDSPGVYCNTSPTFMNCTFASNASLSAATGGGLSLSGTSAPTIKNCIFYNNSGYGIRSANDNGVTVYNSDFNSNPAGDVSKVTKDATCITSDPLLKNPSGTGGDYHISSTSPCIGSGTSSGAPSVDLDNRPRTGGIDIGCYQYIAGDPPITGTIYDSVTGETISSPVVAIYQAGTTTVLSTTTSNPYTFNVDPGRYYIAVAKDGYGFPSQVVSVVTAGDHGDIFTAGSTPLTIDIPMDSDGWLYIEKTVNKKRVSLGEIVTYNIKIQNKNWYKSVSNVELVDEIVNGFKYVDNSAINYKPQTTNHKLLFDIGTVSANSTTNISYQVRVGMGIPNGRYKASANTRKSTTGARNSNISGANIEVVEDPLFTRGTIIGKVFYDANGNTIQDKDENGISGVKIYTEYGVVVETDEDGKYHIADVPAGNHLLKVNMDADYTTDNPYFVKITEGLLAKVNFGIMPLTPPSPQVGEGVRSTCFAREGDKFFIVALGEGIVRNLDTSGNIDMLEKDDRYDDGVHVDGRLAFYLKGKVLGKYLITASLDTDRRPYGRYDTKELFRNLDPDKYYPVYGDASQVDYSGVNTQDMVYVMIEWDESFARWGSFNTELPLYNRTLSGGIINYQSVGKTKFGDTRTEIKGFGAVSRQKPAHDEFVGTGGSLYYLRHDDVIMGSEKIRVEVRDRIGKTTINSVPLADEKDYEIDYDTGRILLKKPLNSIQQGYSSSIISNDILMGERVYLVIDYEYYSESLSENAYGARASQWVGNHIRVGGGYVQEEKLGDPYKLYGGDTTVKINEDTEINARYYHSEETQLGSTISYDGGLSYQEQYDTFSNGENGNTYGIDGRTKLFNNTDIYLSYNKQDPYFSATDSISQQGSEKYIGNITSRLTDNLTAGISHITQKYLEETTYIQTFADRDVHTTTGILDYQKNKWDMRAEYQHQQVSHPVSEYTYFGTIPLLNNDFIAARLGYQLFKWLHPYIRGQGTVSGESDNQGTVGADIVIYEKTNLNIAETVGNKGNSTLVGLTSKVTEGTDVYANLEVGNDMQLGKYTKTTYGQSSVLSPNSRAYIEEDYSSYRENIVRGNLLGYDKKITDTLGIGLTYERSDYKNMANIINRDAGSIKLAYLNPDWLNANTKLEIRNDTGTNEVRQWVTENDILWRLTKDISLSGRGNWGWSENRKTDTDMAEFYEVGAGFSLRPVKWDRLQILGKYNYLTNLPPDSQWDFIEDMESKRHVYAIEGAFDLFRYLQLVGKFAYRDLKEKVGPRDWTDSDTYLYIARTNFHIMNCEPDKPFILRGWDLGVEYRILANDQIEDKKKGFLVELDKDIGNYIGMGVGYNFTDYDDDLRNEDNWDAKGWFVRVNGKY